MQKWVILERNWLSFGLGWQGEGPGLESEPGSGLGSEAAEELQNALGPDLRASAEPLNVPGLDPRVAENLRLD